MLVRTVKDILLILIALMVITIICLMPSHAQNTLPDRNTATWGAASQLYGSGTAIPFADTRGTVTNNMEAVVSGTAPATLTITITGCMRGNTCSSTLASSSGTASQQIPVPVATVYDYYNVTTSWTGGDATTKIIVNRTGTTARVQSSGAAVTNAVSVSGITTTYTGSDLCAALAAAVGGNLNGGKFNATGFGGNQVCSPTNLNLLNTNLIALGGAAEITLGCPLYWWLPLQKSVAANSPYPALGTLLVPPKVSIIGCSSGSVATGLQTNIAACTGTNAPQPGCTAPQTHRFTISSTTITTAGGRTYLGMNGTAFDLMPGEPIRLDSGTNTDNDTALRLCQQTGVAVLVADPSCPANPTSTLVYAPINSGLVSLAINAAGASYTAPKVVFSGGGCVVLPTASLTQSGGALNTVTILNRGSGCTSVPTATLNDSGGAGTGGTLTPTIESPCTATCTGMTLYASIPLVETVDAAGAVIQPSFGQILQHLTIDCREIQDCVGFRSMTGNEHGRLEDINFTGVVNRGFDIHTKTAANFDSMRGIRVLAGNAPDANPACSVGTEAGYIGDYGPHGLVDFTADFSACGVNAGTVNTNGTAVTFASGANFNTKWAGSVITINKVPFTIASVTNGTTLTLNSSAGVQNGVAYQMATPNWSLRVNVNYNSFYMMGGHSEAVQYGIMIGDANPSRGLGVNSWFGPPNANLAPYGAYRSEQPAAIKIRSEYYNAGCAASTCTTDYVFTNISRNFGGGITYTISDDNPVGPNGTDGPHFLDTVTSFYAVDQGANNCTQAISTGAWGSFMGCGNNVLPATGGNYFGQTIGSATSVGNGTASNVTLWGPFYNSSYLTGLGHINYVIVGADATANTYELGIVGPCTGSGVCPKVGSTGSIAGTVFAPTASTAMNIALSASIALAPGRYYLALACGTGCTATMLGAQNMLLLGKAQTAGTTIPAFITAPTDTSQSVTTPEFILRP